jgi:hypothetical protein
MRKIAFALFCIAALAPTVADAQTGIFIRVTYYSDPALTNVVGQSVQFCDGSSTSNGYPTEYSTYEEFDC